MGFVMGSFVKPDTPGMGQAAANAGQNPGQNLQHEVAMFSATVQTLDHNCLEFLAARSVLIHTHTPENLLLLQCTPILFMNLWSLAVCMHA